MEALCSHRTLYVLIDKKQRVRKERPSFCTSVYIFTNVVYFRMDTISMFLRYTKSENFCKKILNFPVKMKNPAI